MVNRTRYLRQLDELDSRMSRVGEEGHEGIASSGLAIAGCDHELAQQVADSHHSLQRLCRSVEDGCMSIMLLQQPLAGDLRFVTAAFRAVVDLARINDMVLDIAELALEIEASAATAVAEDMLDLSRQAATMVARAVGAFSTIDASEAEAVFALDDGVDDAFSRTRAGVVGLIKHDAIEALQAPELLMIAKYYERIGDHAQSIADWAVFRATGSYQGRIMGEAN